MDIKEAQNMAEEKIGIYCPEYSFEWLKAKRRFGQCNCTKKLIGLSKPLVEINDDERVLNTILHEIAHVLAGTSSGHGWRWRRECRKIGIEPRRCYSSENTNIIKGNYQYECKKCGRIVTAFRRKRRSVACTDCCNKFYGGRFSDECLLEFIGVKEEEQ